MKRRHFFARIAAFSIPAAAAPASVSTPAVSSATADLSPADIPAWLKAWRQLPRHPIWESSESTQGRLIHVAVQSQTLRVTYHAGSTPGESRLFSPSLLFRTAEGDAVSIYVTGWCHQRRAHRTFRLDHLSLAES